MTLRKPARDIKALATWDNKTLLNAITTRLQARFGELPQTGVLAGQAVASACYELVGIGSGPMRDLDWFVENDRPDDFDNVVPYRNIAVPSDGVAFHVNRMSFCDELEFSAVNKGGYFILFSGTLVNAPDINVVGCKSGVRNRPVSGEVVISGFDINCVEIAVDLDAKRVVWTSAFQDFLYSKTLRVTRGITPAHTVLRLMKKQSDLPFVNVELEREIWVLKMARQIGVMLEPEDKKYLPTQLFSEETVKKHWPTLQALSSHYRIDTIEVTLPDFVVDDQAVDVEQQSDNVLDEIFGKETCVKFKRVEAKKVFYKLMPQGLSEADMSLCKSMLETFLFSTGTAIEAYQRASGLLFKEINTKVSASADKAYRDLITLIENNDVNTVVSRHSIRQFFRRYGISDNGIYERAVLVIKWLLRRDMHLASKLVRRDVKNIMKLNIKHSILFADYANTDITVLAKVADNVRWLEKRNLGFVVGLFESYSTDVNYFDSLESDTFKETGKSNIEKFLEIAKTRKFEPVTKWLPAFQNAISKEDLNITVLSSQLDFLVQGEQERHCVGGFYDTCASYNSVTLAVAHKRTGATATALYGIEYRRKDKEYLLVFRLRQYYGKENSDVAFELRGKFDKEIVVAVDLNSLPNEFKLLVHERCKNYDLEFETDTIPF